MATTTLATHSKSIVCLLEMVKSMAGTNIEVSEGKKIICIFRKAQAHPATCMKTYYSHETVNRSGITVLKSRSEVQ